MEKEKPQRPACRNDFVGQWEGNDGRQTTTDTIRETTSREDPRERESESENVGAEERESEREKERERRRG